MARTVMFESWRGRYADSPRAVSELLAVEQPQLRQLWVTNGSSVLPDSAVPLRRHSPEYFARLLSTDYLLTNDIVSKHLVKGPRVTYVQAWHGTPLKTIGFDERLATYSGAAAHRRRMVRDVGKWDYLLSPSPLCTEIFRRAFRYEGPVLETGYPRNDILKSAAADTIRTRVRAQLGLAPAAKVVLYAPTWRDDNKNENGSFKDPGALDVSLLRELTADGTVLLSRMHNVVDSSGAVAEDLGGFYQDVSSYPDIAELYLAADVLVSDYSSAVYDFAVTGKPIVLFAYDLAKYRDSVRGLYFDYEDWAPGVIVTDTEALAAALNNAATAHSLLQTQYSRFVDMFCPLEDGHASRRVVQQVFSA